MEFEGVITMIGQEEEIGENKRKKLTFVVEEDSDREYKSSIAVDLWEDRINNIKEKGILPGDKVRVGLNFKAREYNGRRFNGISAWKVDKLGMGTSTPAGESTSTKPVDDDLPF